MRISESFIQMEAASNSAGGSILSAAGLGQSTTNK